MAVEREGGTNGGINQGRGKDDNALGLHPQTDSAPLGGAFCGIVKGTGADNKAWLHQVDDIKKLCGGRGLHSAHCIGFTCIQQRLPHVLGPRICVLAKV